MARLYLEYQTKYVSAQLYPPLVLCGSFMKYFPLYWKRGHLYCIQSLPEGSLFTYQKLPWKLCI